MMISPRRGSESGRGGTLGDLLDSSDSGAPPLPPPDAVETPGVGVWAGPIFWQGSAAGSAQNGAYTNWTPGKPNDSGSAGEDCGVLYLKTGTEGELGRWNDYVCADPHAFLCERAP